MSKENNTSTKLSAGLVPKLRFSEFKNNGEWKESLLNEVSPTIFDGTHQTPTYKENGIPFFSVENIISRNKNKFISREDYLLATSKNKPEKGDIIITRIGNIGTSKVIDWDYEFSVYVTLAIVKKSSIFDSHYLHSYFQSSRFQKEILSKSLLNAVPCKINMDELRRTKILLPPDKEKKEQQKIAACLSSLDEVIIAESQKLEVLKDHKKGLLQNLFPQEGDTVPKFRFKEFEDSGEWVEKSIQQLLDEGIITSHLDGNHGSLYPRADEFSREGVPYITANDFIAGVVDFSKCKRLPISKAKQFKKGVAKSGDILFAHNATVGPVAKLITNLPFVVLSTTATYFRCDNVKLINDYMKYALTSTLFVKQYIKVMSQSTRNQVPITTQRKFFIYIPNPNEQKKIASCLSSIDDLINAQTQKIELLKQHKKGLLQGLFPDVNEVTK